MNYGYNRATPGYVRRRQARLAAALGALCARADFAVVDFARRALERGDASCDAIAREVEPIFRRGGVERSTTACAIERVAQVA